MSESDAVAKMRSLTNLPKSDKQLVLKAISLSGTESIEWRDSPDCKMPAPMRDNYGSVWANGGDLSKFWAAMRNLRGEPKWL